MKNRTELFADAEKKCRARLLETDMTLKSDMTRTAPTRPNAAFCSGGPRKFFLTSNPSASLERF